MTGQAGREYVVAKDGTPIAGIRMTNVTVNGTPISDDDGNDDGFSSFIPGKMVDRTLEFSVDGVIRDEVLRVIAFDASATSPSFFSDLTFSSPTQATIAGDFVMTSYTEGAPYKEAMTFSATFTSDGPWTYVGASG